MEFAIHIRAILHHQRLSTVHIARGFDALHDGQELAKQLPHVRHIVDFDVVVAVLQHHGDLGRIRMFQHPTRNHLTIAEMRLR